MLVACLVGLDLGKKVCGLNFVDNVRQNTMECSTNDPTLSVLWNEL